MYPITLTFTDQDGNEYPLTVNSLSEDERDLRLDALSRGEWKLTSVEKIIWVNPLRERKQCTHSRS